MGLLPLRQALLKIAQVDQNRGRGRGKRASDEAKALLMSDEENMPAKKRQAARPATVLLKPAPSIKAARREKIGLVGWWSNCCDCAARLEHRYPLGN